MTVSTRVCWDKALHTPYGHNSTELRQGNRRALRAYQGSSRGAINWVMGI